MESFPGRRVIVTVLAALTAGGATAAGTATAVPAPGVVAGGFCTYRTGYLATSRRPPKGSTSSSRQARSGRRSSTSA